MDPCRPLLRIYRGAQWESQHRGAFVVVEDGEPIMAKGDPDWRVYYRSTNKPIQAIGAITSGAVDAYGVRDAELAVATGSHNAEPSHVTAVRAMLARAEIDESALLCGGHWSIDAAVAAEQRIEAADPRPIWSNCSGKHALMLATAKHLGAPLETYLDADHPVQELVRRHTALLAGIDAGEVTSGIDGCSAPAFAVPLVAMARSLASFGAPEALPDGVAAAARRIRRAMVDHPEMVAGEGRFDTVLMRAAKTPLIAKCGAEAVMSVIVPSRRIGIALRVEDGNDRGYRLVVLALLRHLDVISREEHDRVAREVADPILHNHAGLEVGHVEVLLD